MVSNVLNDIVAAKQARLAAAQSLQTLDQLRRRLPDFSPRPHALAAALAHSSGIKVIAEFKRRSPSKGVIRENADPTELARAYEKGGATGISVLTEEDFFDGSLADLRAVREAVRLPLLRKDFIFDEYQVWESAVAGADALLLIVSMLSDEQLASLRLLTEEELGMDALVEVHSADELKRALAAGAHLIGVNNRDLRSFEVSLDTSEELARLAPSGTLLISESGLRSRADLLRLQELGYRGFLIGETLMRSAEPEKALRSLVSAV